MTESAKGQGRIVQAFEQKAFIPFITCGDPDLETTKACIREMEKNGADLIELGIPFSDPTAEGPVIQAANVRALKNGITTDDVLNMAAELRQEGVRVPFVIMTYANVPYSYGTERFMKKAAACGIDGLILPDVPFEEKEEFAKPCRAHGLALISLVAPTSKDRVAAIAREAEGFVYLVSSLGVTGMRASIETDLDAIVGEIRKHTEVPVAIGFGISTPEQAKTMAARSDGAIVGSAIVKLLETHGHAAPAMVEDYVRQMKEAVRAAVA